MIGWLRLVRGERPQPNHFIRADRAGLDPLTSHFAPDTDDPARPDGATRRPAGTTHAGTKHTEHTKHTSRATRTTGPASAKRTIKLLDGRVVSETLLAA